MLWLIGYVLGIALFPLVPNHLLGWVITPIGTIITIWVLWKKVQTRDLEHNLALAFAWTAIAVALDYFLLVRLFKPADGYYKLDVYLYYALAFLLPISIGHIKAKTKA